MNAPRIVLIAAQTNRTMAYATAIRRLGLELDSIFVYPDGRGEELPTISFPDPSSSAWGSLPDWLRTDWKENWIRLCSEQNLKWLDAETVNQKGVEEVLENRKPDLVLFSGLPGEIVKSSLVGKWKFLHVHPGRLPSFRGSTVIYWALLHEEPIVCSLILLTEKIDQGPKLFEMVAPPPLKESDLDNLYDPGIRALALFEYLSTFPDLATDLPNHDSTEQPTDFFVIHPVLKTFALAKLDRSERGTLESSLKEMMNSFTR